MELKLSMENQEIYIQKSLEQNIGAVISLEKVELVLMVV
jgi:hypothetical protein